MDGLLQNPGNPKLMKLNEMLNLIPKFFTNMKSLMIIKDHFVNLVKKLRTFVFLCGLLMTASVIFSGGADYENIVYLPVIYNEKQQSKIAFAGIKKGKSDVYVVNSDSTGLLNLTNTPDFNVSRPQWSPDGKKLAFSTSTIPSMAVINSDGTGFTYLNMTYNGKFCWSEDGEKILFGSWLAQEYPGVYSINLDGSGVELLTKIPYFYAIHNWSPDRNFILLHLARNIYRMNMDGSSLIQLTNSGIDSSPNWSPDGKKIVFKTSRDQNSEIYVMNSNGTEQKNLTNNPGRDSDPIWSPDGTKIAFRSDRPGNKNYDIFVMNTDGSNQTQLTFSNRNDDFISWSPDGKKIAFKSYRDSTTNIYTVNYDGSNLFQVTKFRDIGVASPVWQP